MTSREFKLQVWDGVKICGVKLIEFTAGSVVITTDGGYFGYLDSDFKLMQYIGMMDKNKRDIYDGYIVKNHTTGKIYEVAWYGKPAICGWWFKNKDGFTADRMGWDEIEVIGNIYENPERMK